MREDLKSLLKSAEEDLEVSKKLFKDGYFRYSSFFAQQSVEKYLKAFLLFKKNDYPFVHSIAKLINDAIKLDKDFNYLFEIEANKLSRYYITSRYPPLIVVSEEEAKEAVEIAERVREFILRKLNV